MLWTCEWLVWSHLELFGFHLRLLDGFTVFLRLRSQKRFFSTLRSQGLELINDAFCASHQWKPPTNFEFWRHLTDSTNLVISAEAVQTLHFWSSSAANQVIVGLWVQYKILYCPHQPLIWSSSIFVFRCHACIFGFIFEPVRDFIVLSKVESRPIQSWIAHSYTMALSNSLSKWLQSLHPECYDPQINFNFGCPGL